MRSCPLVGQAFVNDTLSIAFLGLAAGSILYVVIELLAVARKAALKEITRPFSADLEIGRAHV